MSIRVAVLTEDPTNDQYIVRPVLEAAMAAVGKPRAIVRVIHNPKTGGWSSLLKVLPAALARWGGMADVVVVVADADCLDGRDDGPDRLVKLKDAIARAESPHCVVGLVAIQEVEVWACWGRLDELGVTWQEVREECHPKERFFDGLTDQTMERLPDGGRGELVRDSLSKGGWRSLRDACSELAAFESQLQACV